MLKRSISLLLTLMLAALSCAAAAEGGTVHRIGVATYDIRDAQVMMFKDYLNGYISVGFEDVEFLYSDSLNGKDDMMDFLRLCAEQGCEGILSFNTCDLKAEVDYCASQSMYYLRPASTSSDADFEAVADSPWFLGEIGPGLRLEQLACEEMVRSLCAAGDGHRFILLSGGASIGNEMHRIRTLTMLETLADVYGLCYDRPVEELALVAEPTLLELGDTAILICPGYVALPQYAAAPTEAILSGSYDIVLSTIAVTPLTDALSTSGIRCGTTDCFSEENLDGFKAGRIAFVAGKYESEIGPAFAAMYNAVTGYADRFRDNGRAFRLEQGYWTASDTASYESMYALSSGIYLNAYSCEDLFSVISLYNDAADLTTLQTLTQAYTYQDALTRRGM